VVEQRRLLKAVFHYRVENSPPFYRIPSRVDSLRNFIPSFSKIHFNIILPFRFGYPISFLQISLVIFLNVYIFLLWTTLKTVIKIIHLLFTLSMKFTQTIYKFRFPICSKHTAYPLQRLADLGENCYFLWKS
jgi:hypothetical protein